MIVTGSLLSKDWRPGTWRSIRGLEERTLEVKQRTRGQDLGEKTEDKRTGTLRSNKRTRGKELEGQTEV